MTIDPTDFVAQGKPTLEQAKTVHAALPHQTCDTLHEALTKVGFDVARSTCARWIRNGFKPKAPVIRGRTPMMEIGKVKGVLKEVAQASKTEALIGSKMDLDQIETDMADLAKLDMPGLKAVLEKERMIYNILMLRYSQRNANKLVLVPGDSAKFVVAMTDAAGSTSTVAPGIVPGDNATLIENPPQASNPVSDAIALFKQRQGGKAA